MNLRRFCKQIATLRLFGQGRCHLTFEMRVASGFGIERIEDGIGGWAHLDGEP